MSEKELPPGMEPPPADEVSARLEAQIAVLAQKARRIQRASGLRQAAQILEALRREGRPDFNDFGHTCWQVGVKQCIQRLHSEAQKIEGEGG